MSEKQSARGRGDGVFVIHKHDASTLHYDFRLEIDGTLKSWAVPKGPSTDPRERRLAIQTDDHPLDYAEFEGVIPDDRYGGGTVMIWDRGRYRALPGDDDSAASLSAGLKRGLIEFELFGEKLSGGYALTHMEEDRWLLVKTRDQAADARRNPTSTEPRSVASDRTLRQIGKDAADTGDGD